MCHFKYGLASYELTQWGNEAFNNTLEDFRCTLEVWVNTHPKDTTAFVETNLSSWFNVEVLDETEKKVWY